MDITDSGNEPGAAYDRPSAAGIDIEARIARSTVRRAIVVAPVILLIAGIWRGQLGAVSAAIGVLIVIGNFVLSGVVLSRAATVSLKVYHAAALIGFLVRLGLITATMFLVAALFEVDRRAMGVAAVVAYMALLSWEAWAYVRSPGRDFEWSS